MRRRYENLLSGHYSAGKVYIRSSDTDRSLMSAQCVTAGLFPPSGDELWNTHLRWQPIPIHTIALEDDYLLNSRVECPRGLQDFFQHLYSPEIKSLMEENRPLIEFLERHSGMKVENLDNLLTIYYVLSAQKRRGLV